MRRDRASNPTVPTYAFRLFPCYLAKQHGHERLVYDERLLVSDPFKSESQSREKKTGRHSDVSARYLPTSMGLFFCLPLFWLLILVGVLKPLHLEKHFHYNRLM